MNAPDTPVPLQPTAPSRAERLFPTLTAAQIARIAAHGRRRPIARGEVLVEVGDKVVPFFVVVSGEIQVLRPSGGDRNAHRHTPARAVLGRRQHDHGPPGAGAAARQRAG